VSIDFRSVDALPADRRLSTLVRDGSEEVAVPLRGVARLLAAHHATAKRSAAIDSQGTAAALRRRWTENLDALQEFRDTVVDADDLDEIQHRALRYIDGRHPLLRSRIAAGRIRNGHGDLFADDIFCLPDGPRVLDCLEFDDDLRSVDGLDDAACLAMDLERLGAQTLAERFLDWFIEFSADLRVDSLVHHYVAYRAVVRLKVACLRWAQGDDRSADTAELLTDLALAHLRLGEPRMILVGGSPGTGKSTVAAGLAQRLGAVLVGSEATDDDLITRAVTALGQGESVVLDASWSSAQMRDRARQAAIGASATVAELRCCAPAGVIDAPMERGFEPWPEAIDLHTTETPHQALERAVRMAVLG